MKKIGIALFLFSLATCCLNAQVVVYSSLKDFAAQRGDTLAAINVEKRAKNQIMLSGGADYKLSVDDNEPLSKYLKKRCFLVKVDSTLYVSCRKLRYKKLQFGAWYAPAMLLNGSIYFSAIPLGTVAAGSSTNMSVTLGGTLGDAIAASGQVSKRVYYEIDGITGRVDFVGKEKMLHLLTRYPALKEAYIEENSESAEVTGNYLRQLIALEK
ncbi:DUF6563 family protein [Bacteroides sp.]|uniref:DUF6563 family protein n=3 Tax=Bacteroides sp. TaxID=29523 RepID=UPI001B653142|nr:DUF6563 family protein [Bacteroides sp.]MBP6065455.1 hypothetical protein [Bacteroides sp.]MBP6067442.1 hypothetical protein [Bacteroides sp.]MBP6936380.1 hypothetical protein [Bacteroides sp.]MBP9586509.1 hypothetical protein [Bacteroides sp.]